MKKINNNIPISDNQILNKYILSYTEPDYRIKELNCTFLRYIVETKNKELIDYIFTKYITKQIKIMLRIIFFSWVTPTPFFF